jgi:hypothetical protein
LLLETYEALPGISLLGKLQGCAQLAGQIVGMVSGQTPNIKVPGAQLLETYEALPGMSLLGKLGGYTQLAGQIVGMVSISGRKVFCFT